MVDIEIHGPPVYGAQGPFWSVNASVSVGELEPTEVLIKLAHRADETFARKLGDRYGAAVRETIMQAFAEEQIKEAFSAGHTPPQELTIRVTEDDVELHLTRWRLLE